MQEQLAQIERKGKIFPVKRTMQLSPFGRFNSGAVSLLMSVAMTSML